MNYAAQSTSYIAPATKRRVIPRNHNSAPIYARELEPNSCVALLPYYSYDDGFSTEGMTYSSHFFIRIATFEMTWVALPFFV
jgi:hypothetical protein